MNKFQKLAQLNQDIELLENAGKIKAANILHKKFIREAQEYQKKPSQELMNEIFLTAQNPTNEYNDLIAAYNTNRGSYTGEEQAYIKRAIERANKQRSLGTFSTSVQAPNPTVPGYSQAPVTTPSASNNPYQAYQTPVDSPVNSSTQNYAGQNEAYQMAQPVNYNNPQLDLEIQANRAIKPNNVGDTANPMQSQNTMPATETNERQIYMNALNDIMLAFEQGDNQTAETIYNGTINKFTNLQRRKYFGDQIQRLRTKYLVN
jgi:hypothetical protein